MSAALVLAQPFSLGPVEGPRVALFHGLTGSPAELWPLGLGLAAAGYRMEAPLWEGHGISPEVLAHTSAEELIEQARRIARENRPLAFIGSSMGGLLAIIAAAEAPSSRALVLLAPAITLAGQNRLFQQIGYLSALRHSHRLISKSGPVPLATDLVPLPSDLSPSSMRAARAAVDAVAAPDDSRYDRIPLRWARELMVIREEAHRQAARVKVPALVLHGGEDTTASVESSLEAARWLGGECRLRVFSRSPHVMCLGPERGAIAAEVTAFLDRHVLPSA